MQTFETRHKSLIDSFLLIDRQVYDTRVWAQGWLVLTGFLLLMQVSFLLLMKQPPRILDWTAMAIVLVSGAFLSHRERQAKRQLLKFKYGLLGDDYERLDPNLNENAS